MAYRLNLVIAALVTTTVISGCSTTETKADREESSRPRVEQRALSNAIDIAFKNVNFSAVIGKKVFIDTQSLAKLDVPFINAYISGLILEKGGIPVQDEKIADIKIFNIVKTSGTDDIRRWVLSDKVRGEYRSVMTFVDLASGKIIATYELSGEGDENR
jgi:uncharacterized protein YceK